MHRSSLDSKGFTLIELSIVLVIIGLIVAGVVGGQSLIRSANLKAVTTDINKFKRGIMTYEDYYEQLPGDHDNAYAYWGNDCEFTADACNGNNDNQLTWNDETDHVWEHLNLSGILPTDTDEAGSWSERYPSASTDNGLYLFGTAGTAGIAAPYGRTGHMFVLGATAGGIPLYATINPADAESIDRKMDDGLASTGDVRAGNDDLATSGCVDDRVIAASADYTLSNTGILCHMFFFYE